MKRFTKNIKSVLFVILAVSMVFGIFGCSGSKKAVTGELDSGYVPDVKGKLELTASAHVYASESSQMGIRNWVAHFEDKYPEVDVQVNFNISMENYGTHIAAKDIGDVYWLDDGSVYKYAISDEALVPLDHYAEALNIDLSQVYTGILELGRVDGRLYFAGMSCGQQSFIYNTSALQSLAGQYGIDENGRVSNEWTWEDFKNIAAKVTYLDTETAADKRVMASMKVNWAPYYTPFLSGFGGDWADTTNKRVNFTSGEVKKGLEELFYAMDNDWIWCPDGSVQYTGNHAERFTGINELQNCVFQWNQAYTNLASKGKNLNDAGIEWDVAPFPLFEYAASPCGTIGFGVFKYTTNPDAAAALVLSLYTEDGQMAIHGQSGGDVPLLKSLGADDFWHLSGNGFDNKNYAAFTANYEKYIPSHVKASVPQDVADVIEGHMGTLFTAWSSNTMDLGTALANMEQQANEMWTSLS